MDNINFNSKLLGAYKNSTVKLAALRKKVANNTIGPHPKSKVDSTMRMCSAWHTKELCNSNCPYAHNHVLYTTMEYSSMIKWCKEEEYKSK